jgi:SAM-dependent methyltransferase
MNRLPFLDIDYIKTFIEFAWTPGWDEVGRNVYTEVKKLFLNENNEREFNILFPGIAPGIQTLPFIDGFIKDCNFIKELNVVGIDYSEYGMKCVSYLFKNLFSNRQKIEDIISNIIKNQDILTTEIIKGPTKINEKVNLSLYLENLEFYKFDNFIEGKFNIIPCFFVLHYLHNWRKVLDSLVRLLTSNGIIIFVESKAIQKVLTEEPFIEDFDEKYESYINFWNDFWKIVKSEGHFIDRELTDSNYAALKKYIKMFHPELKPYNSIPPITCELNFQLSQMLRWIEVGILGFWYIEENLKKNIIERLEKKYTNTTSFSTKREFHFFLFKKQNQ